MAPRHKLSERLNLTPDRRTFSGELSVNERAVPQLQDMQRQAEELEARAARADELEQRLQVNEPDI